MSEYRDYGHLNGWSEQFVPVDTTRYTQTYLATHEGGLRLSLMNRAFISFTYGGKHIEDFNLIATISGNRLSRDGYATFDDMTSTYNNLEGQQYWGSHYRINSLALTLSTDGIDERMLDQFKLWFCAGKARELVLAEHPNRAIMARIKESPRIELLPFESEVEFKISSIPYKTKTTLYKGDIQLTFVMDEPHWYAIDNILGKKIDNRYVDRWDDANGNEVSIFASQDALKILYEDGIPLGSMIDNNMLLGNGTFANVESNDISLIWNPDTGVGAKIDSGNRLTGVIAGAIVSIDGSGITTLSAGDEAYFFYSGTAPSPTIIEFTLTPQIENGWIVTPYNSHTSEKYNTFIIQSQTTQELRFTTPNIFTSYNKAIEIFTTLNVSTKIWEDIQSAIRDEVRHPAVRQWANAVCTFAMNSGNQPGSVSSSTYVEYMEYFLKDKSNNILPFSCSFNSKTGEALGKFSYRTINTVPSSANDWASAGSILENQIEDIGDMVRSNYIIIQDRNYPTENGRIVKWQDLNDTTRSYSHMIKHNVPGGLKNIQILYKNMYL